jgi:small subunit ribosomal protein S6
MRQYELAYIADPDLDEQSLRDLEERVEGWINAAGGSLVDVDRWGRKRFAYPIQKKGEGFYVFMRVQMPPQASSEVERDLRLNEQILRYMITVLEQA